MLHHCAGHGQCPYLKPEASSSLLGHLRPSAVPCFGGQAGFGSPAAIAFGPLGSKGPESCPFSQASPGLDFSFLFTLLLHWMGFCQRPQVSGTRGTLLWTPKLSSIYFIPTPGMRPKNQGQNSTQQWANPFSASQFHPVCPARERCSSQLSASACV